MDVALASTEFMGSWVADVAQRHAPDVVTCAVLCRPNAPRHAVGSHLEGFEQRQLLKAAGRYRAERVVIATTPLEVLAIALSNRGRVRHVDRWTRASVPVAEVPSRDRSMPARRGLLIGHAGRYEAVEVLTEDPADERRLIEAIGPSSQASPRGVRR